MHLSSAELVERPLEFLNLDNDIVDITSIYTIFVKTISHFAF